MKRINFFALFFLAVIAVSALHGCGYTYKSVLPEGAKSLHVDNFKSKIDLTAEISDRRVYVLYRPGLEIELTREVINRFITDGNIAVKNEDSADLLLKGDLIDFRKEALRYDANDNAVEFRVKVVVNLSLYDRRTAETLWAENNFVGESIFRTEGQFAKSEAAAQSEAVKDLARRIVERTVEGW